MVISRKISQVDIFAGSPWEAVSVKNLLNAAYIEVAMQDRGNAYIQLSVPCECYTAAMRIISGRFAS